MGILVFILILFAASAQAATPFAARDGYTYQFIMAGDSITGGYPHEQVDPETYPYQFCHTYTSCTHLNKGSGGTKASHWAGSSWDDLVTSYHPRYVIFLIGINDIQGATQTPLEDYIGYVTTSLDKAEADGIIPIVVAVEPCTYCDTTKSRAKDAYNVALKSLVESYPVHVWVDCNSRLGQFREGGDAGNLWDIKTAYNGDNVHLSDAGYAELASCIWDAIKASPYVNGNAWMGVGAETVIGTGATATIE